MNWTPPIPTSEQLKTYFPESIQPPADGTFEVGLVLGGTVSAGAYTAGVLDFITEALDAWDLALEKGDQMAPSSRVVLKVIGGASGGGVCAGILGRMAPYAFPHVTRPTDSNQTGNLFYDVWVNQLNIERMLGIDDLANGKPLASVLNVAPIDDAGKALAQFAGQPLGHAGTNTPQQRRWLDPTLSLFFTLTNLRGMPYKIDFDTGALMSQSFTDHADFVRFQIDTRPGVSDPVRPDAFGLSNWRSGEDFIGWDAVPQFLAATGAFPIGFKPRNLSRPLSHYAYRAVTVPDANFDSVVSWLNPDWNALEGSNGPLNGVYNFPCVDGGAADNAPVELVRTALAGMTATNPRKGEAARRALILIDPFAEATSLGPQSIDKLQDVLAPFLGDLIAQARYDTADLALAADEKVFSRFMISARRDGLVGSPALATSGMSAFQGFLCRAFREHDYLLGRRNAYDFLKKHFALPFDPAKSEKENNPMFADKFWSPTQKKHHKIVDGGKTFLPIIPLLGSVANAPDFPKWPQGSLNPETLRDAIDQRIKAVVKAAETSMISSATIRFFLSFLTDPIGGSVTDAAINTIKESLRKSKL